MNVELLISDPVKKPIFRLWKKVLNGVQKEEAPPAS